MKKTTFDVDLSLQNGTKFLWKNNKKKVQNYTGMLNLDFVLRFFVAKWNQIFTKFSKKIYKIRMYNHFFKNSFHNAICRCKFDMYFFDFFGKNLKKSFVLHWFFVIWRNLNMKAITCAEFGIVKVVNFRKMNFKKYGIMNSI